jgi:hypothetical protein
MMPFRIPKNYHEIELGLNNCDPSAAAIREYLKWLHREIQLCETFLSANGTPPDEDDRITEDPKSKKK